MTTQTLDIAVIGGGIAGLSAALAAQNAGQTAEVFEASGSFRPIGASITLWPNAMACLADWGIDLAVRDSGHLIDGLAWRRPDGRPYFAYASKDLYRAACQNGYAMRRDDLHDQLLMALDPGHIHLGQKLTSLETSDDHVTLTFATGEVVRARQVIGADGVWSQVRERVLNDGAPRYTGYGAWMGLSPVAAPDEFGNEACDFIGAKDRFGLLETGNDTRAWFLTANTKAPTPQARPANRQEALTRMDDWPEALRNIVKGTEDGATTYMSFYDRPIASRWGHGRVTLVGDAMHPFAPNLGQGACQAIEDAWVLAAGLSEGHDGDTLNGWMKQHRSARLTSLRKTSNRVGRLVQNTSPLMRLGLSLSGYRPITSLVTRDIQRQFARPLLPRAAV